MELEPTFLPSRPFTVHEARELGLTRTDIGTLISAGSLRRPMNGLLLPAALPDTFANRVAAVRLVVPDDAFACDTTAAWLHAGDDALPPNWDLNPGPPTIFRPREGVRLRNAVCASGRRTLEPHDLMEIEGLRLTTPLRTALDLGRLASADLGLWSVSLLMGIAEFNLEQLHAELPRFKGARGVVRLRDHLPWVDPGLESFLEAALMRRWKIAGLPKPETQIELREGGRLVAKIDIGLPNTLFATEADGEEFHDESRAEHDRTRRDWIREERGYDIEVFRGEHLFGPQALPEFRLQRAYADACAALPHKRHFLLAEQRRNP